MDEDAAAHHLLNTLEERVVNVDLDAVLAAFESEETKQQAAAWVNEYLDSSTLLSKEELELYQALERRGLAHRYDDELSTIRPLHDHELSAAIESLESSTAAIEQQIKVLESQQDALKALQGLNKPNMSVEHMRNERRRKETQEKARLDLAIEDISSSITEQLSNAQREIEAERASIVAFVAERLNSDDKMLTALPKIISDITSQREVTDDEKSIDQWCKAVVSFRTAEIKARIDTVYMTKLQHHRAEDLPSESEENLLAEKQGLQKELEELHMEIADLSKMVVDRELRDPIMQIKSRSEQQRKEAQSAWTTYVLSTLQFMSERLDVISDHAAKVNGFIQALERIREAASVHLSESPHDHPAKSRKRTSSAPNSIYSPPVKLSQPKSLQLPPVIEDALRQAGVAFNQDSIDTLRKTLAKTQLERQEKLDEHYASTSASTQENLAGVLHTADLDLRAVLDSLYCNTKYRQVRFTDQNSDEQLQKLERKVESVDRKVIDAELEELSVDEDKVAHFIQRWGAAAKV